MNGFLNDIRSEIKKGNYTSAFLLVLIVIVIIAIPVLWKRAGESTDKIDKVRVECANEARQQRQGDQRRMDSIIFVKDQQIAFATKQLADFKDSYIAKLEKRNENSEGLVSKSKTIIKQINTETKKAQDASKVLDSVSKSLTQ